MGNILNSLYGATINEFCRFFDPRLGASTTGTGRQITKHMIETTAEILTGTKTQVTYRQEVKSDGKIEDIYENESPAIIYGDTDSCYFATFGKDDDEAVLIADEVGLQVNNSFPGFMQNAFLCTDEFKGGIQCGREVVGRNSIFQAKKRYLIHVINADGRPCDKLKAMGSEAKKSDTPLIIREFLKEASTMILKGATYPEIEKYVNEFRIEFNKPKNQFRLGMAKSANNLDRYTDEYRKESSTFKSRMPGHARAAVNYNELLIHLGDKASEPVMNGGKCRVYYVKPNQFGFTSVAINADAPYFPVWFDELFEIDMPITEEKLIDRKLSHLLTAIGWEVPTHQSAFLNELFEF